MHPRNGRDAVSPVGISHRGCRGVRGVPLGMIRMNPDYRDPDPPDRWPASDILVREEPDEEEEDEEDGGEEDGDDEKEDDDGYSE